MTQAQVGQQHPEVAPQLPLFVYGTLLPGEERWGFLEQFVDSDGTELSVAGDLYDTGYGYPAAIFACDPRYRGGTIIGRLFGLRPDDYEAALSLLDAVEGAVEGMYRRVTVGFDNGSTAWGYQVGDLHTLTPIADGDWRTWQAARHRSRRGR